MEVAVMSLRAREQQALDSIEDGLSGADPKLASLLATFARLTAGEEMPVPEKIRAGGQPPSSGATRAEAQCARHACRLGWRRLGCRS
jgi:hypothetical protein